MTKWLSIGDLSAQVGVSVRALRFYEQHGLIAPSRTAAGRRVYNLHDVNRIQQILVLKRAGCALAQIADLMEQKTLEPLALIDLQLAALAQQAQAIEDAKRSLEVARDRLAESRFVDLETLCDLIRLGETAMTSSQWHKVFDQFYTPEEQARWREINRAFPEDVRRNAEIKWVDLITRAEALVGTDPGSNAAQKLVQEWWAMLKPVHDMDPELYQSTGRVYDRMEEWPEGTRAPFSKACWQFMKEAAELARKRQ